MFMIIQCEIRSNLSLNKKFHKITILYHCSHFVQTCLLSKTSVNISVNKKCESVSNCLPKSKSVNNSSHFNLVNTWNPQYVSTMLDSQTVVTYYIHLRSLRAEAEEKRATAERMRGEVCTYLCFSRYKTRSPEGGYPASGGVLRMDFP